MTLSLCLRINWRKENSQPNHGFSGQQMLWPSSESADGFCRQKKNALKILHLYGSYFFTARKGTGQLGQWKFICFRYLEYLIQVFLSCVSRCFSPLRQSFGWVVPNPQYSTRISKPSSYIIHPFIEKPCVRKVHFVIGSLKKHCKRKIKFVALNYRFSIEALVKWKRMFIDL